MPHISTLGRYSMLAAPYISLAMTSIFSCNEHIDTFNSRLDGWLAQSRQQHCHLVTAASGWGRSGCQLLLSLALQMAQLTHLNGLLQGIQKFEVPSLLAGRHDRTAQVCGASTSLGMVLAYHCIHGPCTQRDQTLL